MLNSKRDLIIFAAAGWTHLVYRYIRALNRIFIKPLLKLLETIGRVCNPTSRAV